MALVAIGTPLKPAAVLIGRGEEAAKHRIQRLREHYPDISVIQELRPPWRLSPKFLSDIEKYYGEGLRIEDIGAKLGTTKGHIAATIHRRLPHLVRNPALKLAKRKRPAA